MFCQGSILLIVSRVRPIIQNQKFFAVFANKSIIFLSLCCQLHNNVNDPWLKMPASSAGIVSSRHGFAIIVAKLEVFCHVVAD